MCGRRHVGAPNQSQLPRHAVVCRFAPWWLSVDEFGDQGRCRSYVPADVFRRLKPEVQLLYRHCAVGAEDFLQPENQVKARRAKFVDQPHLRPSAPGSNAHIEVGSVGRDEWEAAHARL